MIKETIVRHLICDMCSSEDDVRSYYFDHHDNDNEKITDNIELCSRCQEKVYDVIRKMVYDAYIE